jgi:succinate-acetate transporter protein
MNDTRTRLYGYLALAGFAALAVLLVLLAVTESNAVGSAAGVVGIVSGVFLGLWLVRTEPAADAAGPPIEGAPEP